MSGFTPYETPPRNDDELLVRLKTILDEAGWVPVRDGSGDGLIGHTLEDLLGIEQNSDRGPDAASYEIKTTRGHRTGRTSLFAFEPYPRPSPTTQLLADFGWEHDDRDEQAFYVTMSGSWTNRGFRLRADYADERVYMEFDPAHVSAEHQTWLNSCPQSLTERPYWTFDDLYERTSEKITNVIFVEAETRTTDGQAECRYTGAELWLTLDFDAFLAGIETGDVQVSVMKRSGKNYGTRFKIAASYQRDLYETVLTLGEMTPSFVEYTRLCQLVADLDDSLSQLQAVTGDIDKQVSGLSALLGGNNRESAEELRDLQSRG